MLSQLMQRKTSTQKDFARRETSKKLHCLGTCFFGVSRDKCRCTVFAAVYWHSFGSFFGLQSPSGLSRRIARLAIRRGV